MKKEEHNKKFHRFPGEAIKSKAEEKLTLKRKRIIAVISFIIAAALFIWFGILLGKILNSDGGIRAAAENFKNLINSYGEAGILVALAIQILQVIVSPIPGQVVEVGMGICYGSVGGALLCLLGSAIGAALIMAFVKKFGIKAVELFVSTDKINEMRFINNEKKLERTVFILYVIPGTPKDPLIFFFGLTKIKTSTFVVLQTLARAPAMFCTTMGGKFLAEQNYLGAILIFAITGILALGGVFGYRKILDKLQERKEHKHENSSNEQKD